MNLFAYCKQNAEPSVKHIPVTKDVQVSLEDVFRDQEKQFIETRICSVEFDGNYKADEGEHLTLEINDEISNMVSTSKGNIIGLEKIDTSKFHSEGIKALFVVHEERLLVQRFTSLQMFNSKEFSFFLDKNTFQRFLQPAFTIGARLCCIIENRQVKFDSFSNLRAIFDLKDFYRAATDVDIDQLAAHDSIYIPDVDGFKKCSSQTIRNLIYKVLHSNVLDRFKVTEIKEKADELEIDMEVHSGKIVLSNDSKHNRKLLCFLDDSYYESNLTGNHYVTNSKRSANSL